MTDANEVAKLREQNEAYASDKEGFILAASKALEENARLREEKNSFLNELDDALAQRDTLMAALMEIAHSTMDAHELAHLNDMQQGDIETARAAIWEVEGRRNDRTRLVFLRRTAPPIPRGGMGDGLHLSDAGPAHPYDPLPDVCSREVLE